MQIDGGKIHFVWEEGETVVKAPEMFQWALNRVIAGKVYNQTLKKKFG